MIEFSRRSDGLFNVWEMTDEGWTVIAVFKTHHEALSAVREMRSFRRAQRDCERKAKLADAADHEPRSRDQGVGGFVQLGC